MTPSSSNTDGFYEGEKSFYSFEKQLFALSAYFNIS
jgi:hypothetical protein